MITKCKKISFRLFTLFDLIFQSSANVYEYLYSHLGSFGMTEFFLLPEWKKQLKVSLVSIRKDSYKLY